MADAKGITMTDRPSQKEYWSGKVGDEWASRARGIDAMLWPMTEQALVDAALQAGESVLDIGCGAGATSLEIARRVSPGGKVVGVDISPQLLAVARERGAGLTIDFREADAGSAELGHRFDAAFSRFGVMFFEEPTRAFTHIRTQMKPGGRLVFICWRPMAENGWATTPVDVLRPILIAPLPKPDPDAPGPFAFADRAKVERILSDAGWSGVGVSAWDGDIQIGGGGSPTETAEFLLKIGPCARAIVDQGIDAEAAKARLMEHLAPKHGADGLKLSAACWIVSARA
ncbi:MAG: hypothetical protein DCF16_02875 [Alphaproteobacteria bacterium]|nr:MAG: hypothetical protein DCF16_02875 [Alphaproteobacteria bacterium]